MKKTCNSCGCIHIHTHSAVRKTILILLCLIFVSLIFSTPIKATNSEKLREDRKLEMTNEDLFIDKQLSYAGITSYDSRKYYDTLVFDQEMTGTCWANSALMQLTLSADKTGKGRYVFSRRHAALSINDNLQNGGMFEDLAAYITSAQGPVLEIDMPWKPIESEESDNNNMSEQEKELLNTLKPIIKVNSWERMPVIRKYIDEKGEIRYYDIISDIYIEDDIENNLVYAKYDREYDELYTNYAINWKKMDNIKKASKIPVEQKEELEQFIKECQEYANEYAAHEMYEYANLYRKVIMFILDYGGEIPFNEYCNSKVEEIRLENKKIQEEMNNLTCKVVQLIGVELSKEEVEKRRDNIKRAILKYGGVNAIIRAEFGISAFSDENNYQYSGYNYNLYEIENCSNHAVMIIGWDDNFSVENFPEENRPTEKGAYLVQNSWGKNWNNDGCFWISYEDMNIEYEISIFKDIVDIDYDNIYQYDLAIGGIIYKDNKKAIYGANVFDRNNTNIKETIKEVAVSNTCETKYEVYINPKNGNISNESELIKVATTEELPAGYNTIKFNKEIELTGEKFAIVIKYENENGSLAISSKSMAEIIDKKYYFVNTVNFDKKINIDEGKSFVGTELSNMLDLTDVSEISYNYNAEGYLNCGSVCIKAFTVVSEKEEEEIEEEPNPSEISKKSETTRIEGRILSGKIGREDLNNSINYSTFSTQKGGEMPSRTSSKSLGASLQDVVLGGSNMTTTVNTGGKSQVVNSPYEGQMLFLVHKEDGSKEQNIYPSTTSVSLASYEEGSTKQIGETEQYQASYIFTYMKENTGYNSEVQEAIWGTDLNTGEKQLPNALGEEANAYASFRTVVNSKGGYEKEIENLTVGQTVTYNRNTKQYTIGPFKVKYIRGFANIEGRKKIDFGAMIDMKMYDQNGKEIDKTTWQIIWNEEDKKARQEGDSDYAYPYSEEEFYIQLNYEGNEEITSISKFEYYYKELETTAEYVELKGSFAEYQWAQKSRGYICRQGNAQNPCQHGQRGPHIYAHDYWISAEKIREISAENLISVTWADTTYNYYTQTVKFEKKKNIGETNNGSEYQIGLTLELTGYVWEDGTGYEDSGDGYRDTNEKGISGVKVILYKVETNGEGAKTVSKEIAKVFDENGNKQDAVTYTTAGGKYHIKGIPVGEYNIEYTYDGQNYTTTKLLEIKEETNTNSKLSSEENGEVQLTNPSTAEEKVKQYKEYANEEAYENNSKTKENAEERTKFNNKFNEIVPGKAIGTDGGITPLEYNNGVLVTTDAEGHVKEEFAMKSNTMENNITYPLDDEFNIAQKNKTINETEYDRAYENMYYINMGLIKRAEADFEVKGDVQESKVTINRKEMTYTYGEEKENYTRELYKADMNYRISDYKISSLNNNIEIKTIKSEDNELKVFVTYKIILQNTAGEVTGTINEIVNYYDENYTMITNDTYIEIEDENGNATNTLVAKQSYFEAGGYTGKINWTSSSKNRRK